jgi:hypothetical protein
VQAPLFDDRARARSQQRAARLGGDRFLHDRAFNDCLDRLADVRASFETAAIVGVGNPCWRDRLAPIVRNVRLGEAAEIAPASIDLCLSIGDFESANDVQTAAFVLRHMLRPGGLLLGAIVGGNSLPRLRGAMLAADRIDGGAAPRLHPSIDGPSLAALLGSVGFTEPVIDVDRVAVSYPNLDRLVGDLRAMGCTNILTERSRRPISRRGLAAARAAFLDGAEQVKERFELLHFAAWAPPI